MKRIVLPLLIVALLLIPLGLTGCEDASCPRDQVLTSLEKMGDVADRMNAPADKLQNVESLDDLGPIRAEFEALRDEAALIEIPECLTEAKFEMVAMYDSYIGAVEALEREDFDAANQGLAEAEQHLTKFQEALDAVANR